MNEAEKKKAEIQSALDTLKKEHQKQIREEDRLCNEFTEILKDKAFADVNAFLKSVQGKENERW